MEPQILLYDPLRTVEPSVTAALAAGGYRVAAAGDLGEVIRLGREGQAAALVACPHPAEAAGVLREAAATLPQVALVVALPPDAPSLPPSPTHHRLALPLRGDELLALVRAAREVRDLRGERERFRQELRQRESALNAFDEVGKTLTSTLQLKEVLNIITEKTTKLVPCEAWSLLLVDPRTRELAFEVAVGPRTESLKEIRLQLGQGIAGWVAQEGKPLMLPDAHRDFRFFQEADRTSGFTTRSVLCVPLASKGRTLGVIELINRIGQETFDQHDLIMVSMLADYGAIAIENARLYEQAEELAVTDDVTQINNMRYFGHILEREMNRAIRHKASISLLFLDLDNFKLVNDTHGHQHGSAVLRQVAHLLKRGLRAIDLVARYGGDEFVILLPDTEHRTAFKLAERLRIAMSRQSFLHEAGLDVKLTVSIGVATFPKHARTKEDLVRLADQAMYQAKTARRNAVCSAADLLKEPAP